MTSPLILAGRVLMPQLVWQGPPRAADGRPAVYLTFDDGPVPAATPAVLDALAQHQAQATFFLLGRQVQLHPELVQRLVAAGHTLGHHSQRHPSAWRTSSPNWKANVMEGADLLTCVLANMPEYAGSGRRVWFRPPYGHITPGLARWAAAEWPTAMWSVTGRDWSPFESPEAIVRRCLAGLRPGAIVLLHDSAATASRLPLYLRPLLAELHSRGYAACGL